MPNGNQEGQQPAPSKFGFLKQWYEVSANVVKRWPLIIRLKFGRKKVGQKHILRDELEETWIPKNDNLWKSLMIIEQTWGNQAAQLGAGRRDSEWAGTFMGDPDGIVQLYHKLGINSDMHRIDSEVKWFEHGTGLLQENVQFKFPEEQEWRRSGWKPDSVRDLLNDPTKPWENLRPLRLRLDGGVVYHKGKKELKEELYCFGRENIDTLKKLVGNYQKQFNLRGLQEAGIPVEIRTKLTDANTAFQELLGRIEEIETEQLDEILKCVGYERDYNGKWKLLVNELSPEKFIKIRFPHTYMIIRQVIYRDITENIGIKDRRGGVIKEYTKNRRVLMHINPEIGIYREEINEIDEQIRTLEQTRNRNISRFSEILDSLEEFRHGNQREHDESLEKFRDGVHAVISQHREELIRALGDISGAVQQIINQRRNELLNIIREQEMTSVYKVELIRNLLLQNETAFNEFLSTLIESRPDRFTDILERDILPDEKLDLIARRLVELLDAPARVELLKTIFRHDDKAIDELFEEMIKARTGDFEEIISSDANTEEKINMIQDLMIELLKASEMISDRINSRRSYLREAFHPIFREEEDKGKPKGHEYIIGDLRSTLRTESLAVSEVIDNIFDAHDDEIRGIVESADNLDTKLESFIGLINRRSPEHDDPIARIKAKKERARADHDRVFAQYNLEINRLMERKTEINFITNRDDIIRELTPRINNGDFQKRDEEVEYGLDEYGHPLEVDAEGYILIDRWWSELAQNRWQLAIIANKPGGKDLLERHLGISNIQTGTDRNGRLTITYLGTPARPQRRIRDDRFIGKLDLLETSALIFSYWDRVRDDLRDGRAHRRAKSISDYTIEGMGGFSESKHAPYLKGFYPGDFAQTKGLGFTRMGTIPTSKIDFNIDFSYRDALKKTNNTVIRATPYDFENVPADERKVTRNYKMRLNGTTKEGERIPNKYNPLFDRRAINMEYFTWGNMYYWRWSGYDFEWSENPFPGISTRGIALWLAYLAASDVYNYAEGEEILDDLTLDYGVRGQGMWGKVNPLSGKGILQEN